MTPEHRIMNEIRLWCGQNDILCFRCNVGRVQLANGKMFDTGLPEGFPDLLILWNKKVLFCEVKTATGKQRSCQAAFQRLIEERGYIYLILRSVQDIINYIKGQEI